MKIFRTIAIIYMFCFIVYSGYLAFSAFKGAYISTQQNYISIGGAIICIVLAGINAFLSRKK